jgi:flagella basal body P-ring formation protein FlgA
MLRIVYPKPVRKEPEGMKSLRVGLLAGIMCLSLGTSVQQAYSQDAGKIVYATQNIPEGHPVAATALEERNMPPDKIPPDAVRSVKEAAGKIATTKISKGQIVSKNDLK